ncbi:hypothetical protein [Xanthomonas phaseoli]|uniref:hypothetical protein n=1 Tax=Xanthomonas phaseoli TaxID=1985254 RepID=UPI00030F2A44|nr:hypothetical protein [Xanthomonas phaseoli]RWU16207.1 hypothetical protein XANMN_12800 [Xanthomonas phaseoli pv. manihotis str. CIO151]UEQ13678.1 hypothetical protein K9838_13160 [Xanthomonas phaseoli pv. manihotis]
MREHPILFNGAMVRAILAGQKTQTRRVVKMPPAFDFVGGSGDDRNDPANWGAEDEDARWWALAAGPYTDHVLPCPFGQPGERLWVRETWAQHADYPDMRRAVYRADPGSDHDAERWRPSIHMPRWACRLVLEITDVRVERLQAISEADALAEGAMEWAGEQSTPIRDLNAGDERIAFKALWESTGGDWDANPWVWVISFQRLP